MPGYDTNQRELQSTEGRSGPLFQHDELSLTQYQFWAMIYKTLAAADLSDRVYDRHSFWIGTASKATGLGFNSVEVQHLGQCRSKAYWSYIHYISCY